MLTLEIPDNDNGDSSLKMLLEKYAGGPVSVMGNRNMSKSEIDELALTTLLQFLTAVYYGQGTVNTCNYNSFNVRHNRKDSWLVTIKGKVLMIIPKKLN